MTKQTTLALSVLGLTGAIATNALAQDSGALIEALVQEGILKESKAEEIRAKLTRDYNATTAGKIKLDSSVKELKISGDVRLRYQHDDQDAQSSTDKTNVTQADRFRLRLRVNADYKLSDNFFAGFGLQTSQNNDSGMQTFANGNANGTTAGGDYHQNYNVFINRAFLGWTPTPGITLIGGKQTNPFYTTDLFWDADINPTGFVEKIDLHKVFDFQGLELSLVAGQFTVSDNSEASAVKSTNRDGYTYQLQLVASRQLNSRFKATIAPGFYWTNGAGVNGNGGGAANGTVGTDAWASTTALQGLKVILVPGDVSFKLFGKPTKVLWDVAYNTDGLERSLLYGTPATAASVASSVDVSGITTASGKYSGYTETVQGGGTSLYTKVTAASGPKPVSPSSTDKLAWLLGFQFGENKKKGDWSFLANYRQVGLSANDPLINDSDWNASYTNAAGYKASFTYNLSNAVNLSLTYQYADNLRKDLGVGLNGAAGPGSKFNSVQTVQADVNVKF